MNTKLAVVLRTDLKMPVGLVASQTAHLTDSWLRARCLAGETEFNEVERGWMEQPYLAILAVHTYEELHVLHEKCEKLDLPRVHLWSDTIWAPTLKEGMKFDIGLAIGPVDSDRIKEVTGTLELYK